MTDKLAVTNKIHEPQIEESATDTFNINGKTYQVITSPSKEVGYYEITKYGSVRLTNFLINIITQIKVTERFTSMRTGKIEEVEILYYDCKIKLDSDEVIDLGKINIIDFNNSNYIKHMFINYFGIKIMVPGSNWKFIPNLAQLSNRNFIKFSEEIDETGIQIDTPKIDIFENVEKIFCPLYGDLFMINSNGDLFGYYVVDRYSTVRISHFIVVLEEQIRRPNRGNLNSPFLSGKIIFTENLEYKFDKLEINKLTNHNTLKKFIINLCGYDAIEKDVYWDELERSIIGFNREILDTIIKDFGYNDSRNEYITENLIITKDSISEIRNPMTYDELFGKNKLTFVTKSKDEIKSLKTDIRDKLLKEWDSPEVMMTSLAFTMLPIIYPYLNDIVPNKFFFMLQGPSGSGKSTVAKWMQRFYGKFDTLLSWTSTEASINYAGNIMKDALIVVDDFKKENFSTTTDIKNAMRTFQNYSDGTGRLRANGLNKLSKEKVIEGFLMLSAEDIVITQTSTIARGIIVEVNSKETNTDGLKYLEDLSKDFSAVTTDYIQYVFNELNEDIIKNYFEVSKNTFELHSDLDDLSYDNRARMINNFSVLATSWKCFQYYLFKKGTKILEESEETFLRLIIELYKDNFKRVSDKKSYIKFANAIWEYSESRKNTFLPIENWGEKTPNTIGCYQHFVDDYGEITSTTICINLNQAFSKLDKYLANKGGIGTSVETLEQQLINNNFITRNESGMVSFPGNKKVRGVKWTGDFPKDFFAKA